MPDWSTITLGGAFSAILTSLILGFWKPWLGAYGEEKGKNLARKEDLAAILVEVQAVTKTQKGIESQLANGTWNRQTLWTQKRDAYADVIKTGEIMARQFGRISAGLQMVALADENQAKHIMKVNELLAAHPPMISDFHSAASVAALFVSRESEKLLDGIICSVAMPEGDLTPEWALAEGKRISRELGRLLTLARKDLHLET